MILSTQPTPIHAHNAILYLTGLFMYGEEQAGEVSALTFFQDFARGVANFDLCTGSYRMQIVYPDGKEIFFADNAGLMRWYIGPKGFFTSLREAALESQTPDYPAAAQFLYYGAIYGMETVVRDVRRSDPNKYYRLQSGQIEEKEKGLPPLEEINAPKDALAAQMRRLAQSLSGHRNIACTITGGVDSRAILAHMIHNNLHPLLDITGKPTDPDVVIAKKVADRLNSKLLFVSDSPSSTDWIDEAIREADGMTGVCGIYRLYKKALCLRDKGIFLECGGLNGEMYKNSFINQDYPFYGGKPNWKHYLRLKVATYDFPLSICGSQIADAMKDVPRVTLEWLYSHTGRTKASAYLSAGYELLQGRCAAITAMNTRYYVQYAPLMERTVVAPMFRENPYSLEMQAFQREQVSIYCPILKDIETDRGLTCNSDKKIIEQVKSTAYLAKVGLTRIFYRGKTSERIDTCFQEGLSSPQYRAALERCKDLGIIAPSIEKLPAGIADRIFALGTIL